MIITTFFPLELPRLPGMRQIVHHVTEGHKGKKITMSIDGESIEATILSIEKVKDGFLTTVEIDDMLIA